MPDDNDHLLPGWYLDPEYEHNAEALAVRDPVMK